MSSKERNKLNWCWIELDSIVKERGRAVSAGELADWMGISRTTALKYLRELIKNKAAGEERVRHNARLKKSVFTAFQAVS